MNAELQVRRTVKEHHMIEAGDTVILGISGGPDSLCLLHILKDMQWSLGFRLQALHVNHLMRVLRGTGVHGIAGMEYVREDGLIRPLLDTPRSEIEAYCESHGLQPRWDSTNADTYYTRNKLRLEVLPLLEKEFNPNLKEGLARLAANAREDDALLEKLAAQTAEGHKGSFPVRELAAMEPALAKRVVRILFAREGLVEDIASAHLESLLEAVHARRTGKVIEFPHGYRAEIMHDEVLFCLYSTN